MFCFNRCHSGTPSESFGMGQALTDVINKMDMNVPKIVTESVIKRTIPNPSWSWLLSSGYVKGPAY